MDPANALLPQVARRVDSAAEPRRYTSWHFVATMIILLAFGGLQGCTTLEDPRVGEIESESAGVISSSRTCYQGEWGSEEAYLARPQTQRIYEDPVQRQRAQERYKIWRERFDCRWIKYPVDDLSIDGFIVKPTGTPPEGGWPVIIYNHGGNADIGEVRFQYIAMRLFPLVDDGFIVMGSQYRGTRIGGVANPDRLRDEYGGADVRDVLSLIDIAEKLPEANAQLLGMWGTSRGGIMAFLSARGNDRIGSMVVESAPTDLRLGLENRPDMAEVFGTWIPEFNERPDEVLEDRSVMYWLDELDSTMPILIVHGAEDGRVSPVHATNFSEALEARGRPHKLVIYEGDAHGIRIHHREFIQEIRAWFRASLMPGSNDTG